MKQKKSKNTEVTRVTQAFLLLFLAMIGYLVWFMLFESDSFINNTYNSKRIDRFAETTVRGKILARDGKVLAKTETDGEGIEFRVYPEGRVFAHAVGFDTNGRSGIEATANYYLLRSHTDPVTAAKAAFGDEKKPGDNVVTSLDTTLQHCAYDAMGEARGAVIVMDLSTGELLTVVSKPDFDPNNVRYDYAALAAEEETGVLINRATQGRYVPGSTFKIVTTLEYLREQPEIASRHSFDCTGTFFFNGQTIHCYHNTAHGEVDLGASFAKSCNGSFAKAGLSLDPERFYNTAQTLFFDQGIVCDLPTERPVFSLKEGATDSEKMETAIGQGKTLMTPMQLLLITSAVENEGNVLKPYVIKAVESENGHSVKTFSGGLLRNVMTADEAAVLKDYMRLAVTEGTASALMNETYTAYGKTGTAEYNDDKDTHAWFTGFAEGQGKEPIAVTVILEGAGSGSGAAVPVAKRILDTYFLR